MPYFICPNCQNRSIDHDGLEGLSQQAATCQRCGFGFLFELLDDYYPAPGAGFVVCDREARIIAAGRGVFELTGYRDPDLLGHDLLEALGLDGHNGDAHPASVALEWGVRTARRTAGAADPRRDLEDGHRRLLPRVRRGRRAARRARAAVTERADVVVVGGGVMGAAIACELAERGSDVLLLERRSVCAGPTRHSTAIVRLHYTQALLVRMAALGLDVYRGFEDRYGTSAGFTRCGMLFGVAEAERETLAANVEVGLAEGARTALVSAEEVQEIDARVRAEGLAFCFEPEAGYCDPYLATAGFAAAAVRAGARVEESAEVTALGDGFAETARGRVEAGAVVVAAGPWSAPLVAPLGYELPIAPAPAEVGRYRLPDRFGPPPPAVADFTGMQFYFRPAEPGVLEVGSLAPEHAEHPVDPDEPVEGARLETLRAYEDALANRLEACRRRALARRLDGDLRRDAGLGAGDRPRSRHGAHVRRRGLLRPRVQARARGRRLDRRARPRRGWPRRSTSRCSRPTASPAASSSPRATATRFSASNDGDHNARGREAAAFRDPARRGSALADLRLRG